MLDTSKVRRLLDTPVGVGDGLIRDLCDEIDRLRAKPQPQGKTVRATFKAFVDPFGNVEIPRFNMNAIGRDSQATPSFEGFVVNITADLPIPEETTVEAEVGDA